MKTGISLFVENLLFFVFVFVVGGYPRLDNAKRRIMFCHKTNAIFSFIFCNSDLSERFRSEVVISFLFYLQCSIFFFPLDWSGEAGAVQKGHGTTSSTDKARNTHKPVLRQ